MSNVDERSHVPTISGDAVKHLAGVVGDDPEVELLLSQERLRVLLTDAMRQARQLKGLTQADLADRMGISQGRVSRLESVDYDRRLDTVVAHLKAVGADMLLALKVDDTIIQVQSPEGYRVSLKAESAVLDQEGAVEDFEAVDDESAEGPDFGPYGSEAPSASYLLAA